MRREKPHTEHRREGDDMYARRSVGSLFVSPVFREVLEDRVVVKTSCAPVKSGSKEWRQSTRGPRGVHS